MLMVGAPCLCLLTTRSVSSCRPADMWQGLYYSLSKCTQMWCLQVRTAFVSNFSLLLKYYAAYFSVRLFKFIIYMYMYNYNVCMPVLYTIVTM